MASQLAEAHIAAQARLRRQAGMLVGRAWDGLGDWDEAAVAAFLATVVPLMVAAQQTAAALTNAFLAMSTGGLPGRLDPALVTGPALRAGATPAEVYRRPFVTYWHSLSEGNPWEDAHRAGRDRASSTAEMDVQLAMRKTLVDVGQAQDLILGYRRVPDAGACEFCLLVAGQRYLTDQLMPIHNRCGCGVEVITAENRGDFTGRRDRDLSVTADGVTAAVEDHGELGPVLVDGAHQFTGPGQI